MKTLRICVVALLVAAGLTAFSGSSRADVPAILSAANRQNKTMTVYFKRVCPGCPEGEQPRHGVPKVAAAKVAYTVSSYVIRDENDRYDWFLLDVTATITSRSGDQDWGWLDTRISSTGTTRILSSSYSLGKKAQNVTECKNFPISLGVGFYGMSAGTEVGSVGFCNEGSKVVQSSITRGRLYHATGVSGITNITMQRYVRVADGKLPTFRVSARTNQDTLNCPTVSDGTICYVFRGMTSKALTIGTTRQQ